VRDREGRQNDRWVLNENQRGTLSDECHHRQHEGNRVPEESSVTQVELEEPAVQRVTDRAVSSLFFPGDPDSLRHRWSDSARRERTYQRRPYLGPIVDRGQRLRTGLELAGYRAITGAGFPSA